MDNEQMAARLVKAEARVLALMNAVAAMLMHHPARADVEASLGQLVELHECALLPKTQPDAVAGAIRLTVGQVLQLSNALPRHAGGPGQTRKTKWG